MGVLEIIPARDVFYPGEWVAGELRLHLHRAVTFTALEASLHGQEFVQITESRGTGKHRHTETYRESVPFLEQPLELFILEGMPLEFGALDAGDHIYQFRAPVPPNMPQSLTRSGYRSHMEVSYALSARLRVPWAFDPRATAEFDVVILRRVTVSLVETPFGEARGHGRNIGTRSLASAVFEEGRAAYGAPLPFALPVPADAAPSFHGALCSVTHAVVAEADLAWAFNPKAAAHVGVS